MGLQYYSRTMKRFVKLLPVAETETNLYISTVDKDEYENTWRLMFKNGQSSTLSSMAESEQKIEFKLWFRFDEEIARAFYDKDFNLKVTDPQLCDGGYQQHLVVSHIPDIPKECKRVPKSQLVTNYQKPTNSDNQASLLITSAGGYIGNV